jgi:predicted transcriptional regulator
MLPEVTDRNPHEVDPHLTARIVASYVRHHTVGTGQVSELITSIHGALAQLGGASQPEEVLTPAVSIRQSVRHEYVVCLDCGYRAKMLRRHLSTRHNLSRDEYLKRWGLRKDHPLIAPAYTEQRSTMARALGLGRKPKAQVAPTRTSPAPVSADADLRSAEKQRRRGTRSASEADVVSKAAAALPRTRKRGSRVALRG